MTQPNICQICQKSQDETTLVPAASVRKGVMDQIRNSFPAFDASGFVCEQDLVRFREQYIESLIEREMGELSSLEEEVVQSVARREILSEPPEDDDDEQRNFADTMSDALAQFGGSWKFLITFACVLFSWIFVNTFLAFIRPFDPYPYIFLNLLLSCLAAIQAPIIMMSQNRQEAKDRVRAQKDYQVNLKAELEIHAVQEKIDHLLTEQWRRMTELQRVQIELLQELRSMQQHSSSQQ